MPFRTMIPPFAASIALSAAHVLAEPSPPLAFETALDVATGERRIERIAVLRDGETHTYGPDKWVTPTVAGYAQAPARIVVALGTPGHPTLPAGLQSETGADLPATPEGAGRLAVLTDDVVNSVLLNIAEDREGLILDFDGGLINGPGADLVIAELSLPAGGISAACPGVEAPGADAMIVGIPGGALLEIPSGSFSDFGPVGTLVNHGNLELGEADVRLESLDAITGAEMRPLAVVSYFKTHVVTVDLSDLDIEPGGSVNRVTLRSTGAEVETEEGPRLCWTSDPAFVAGLPAG